MTMNTINHEISEREQVEVLLPWHAAGTLSRRDAERVERTLAGDHKLAREFELVREEFYETIYLNESLGTPSTRAVQKLFAAIEAEGARAPKRRSFDLADRLATFLSRFAPRTLAYVAAAGGLAIVVQGAMLTKWAVKEQTANEFTLASQNGEPLPSPTKQTLPTWRLAAGPACGAGPIGRRSRRIRRDSGHHTRRRRRPQRESTR